MGLDPTMRASDADREAVAARLREGHAEGRLTMEELQARLDDTFAARTLAELAPITSDLPEPAGGDGAAGALPARAGPSLRAIWGPWLAAVLVSTAVWLAVLVTSGERQGFWPIWVALPWGAVLLARTFAHGGSERKERQRRPGRQDGERDHR